MRKLVAILFSFCILLSGCRNNHASIPIVNIDTLRNFLNPKLLFYDAKDTYRPYSSFHAMFLEQTSGLLPQDVSGIIAYQDDLWVLVNESLRLYDGLSGKLVREYNDVRTEPFMAFDLDTADMKLYCLQSAPDWAVKILGSSGGQELHMDLPSGSEYLDIHYLGNDKLLLTVECLSGPSTMVLDIISGISRSYGNYSDDISHLRDLNREDSLNLYYYPRYILSETEEGLLLKHSFNDTVFKYTPDGMEAVFRFRTEARDKNDKSIRYQLKKNSNGRVLGFWKTDNYWMLQNRFKTRVNGKMVHKNNLSWLDPGMRVHDSRKRWDDIRTGNVLFRPNMRDYEIIYLANSMIGQNQKIYVSDLELSIRNNHFYLYSKKQKKQVIPYFTNAVNYSASTLPVYRFLCDIQFDRYGNSMSFHWGYLTNKLTFYPRIIYRNCILSLAKWKIDIEHLKNIKRKCSHDNSHFLEEINSWRSERNIPSRTQYANSDQTVLIDWKHIPSIEAFMKMVNDHKDVYIQEYFFNNDEFIIHDENNKAYTNEFIFCFAKE